MTDAMPAVDPTRGPIALERLTQRSDFVAMSRAKARRMPAFVLQGRRRGDDGSDAVRVGFTCSRKVGNAVARNRAKRRLREAARLTMPEAGRPGWDYVLIGRRDATATRPFAALLDDLRQALDALE
ncbi:ribonuclease P protein component [Oceaniovalibus guishaninsula JLT2003]|uniref:Ribonuclease P protein component n=1 Tax=Oceaniovalibus guishaninsula JLT2003 TaxID=1231392 RepID=K2H726_9RHOB|nr:ribonuclease P protein component [Oceaniovalibus guishaninsula]EKE43438.1 ribonuclease P protein component [Oceaniovalibus guishaninsula JLT2003]